MIQEFDDRIEFTQNGRALVLRYADVRVNGVLVSEMPTDEKQAYIDRTLAKLQAQEAAAQGSAG